MKDYKKYYHIEAPPEDVYRALTFAPTIMLWTGEPAEMQEVAGSEFSLWDGSIMGKNLAFEPGKKIVQQWYFGDQEVPSQVTIMLHPKEGGTSVELRHTNIPDEAFDDIANGWDTVYFASLREFYE